MTTTTKTAAVQIASKWGVDFAPSSDDAALTTPRMGRGEAEALAAALTQAGFEATAAIGTDDDRGFAWVYLTEPKPKKTLTITMSERRPLKIDQERWPVIARATWTDSAIAPQANRERYIKVREHEDGRRIVYGAYSTRWQGERGAEAGYLVDAAGRDAAGRAIGPDEAETVRAIRRVAGVIGDDGLGAECIGDLPAEAI